MATINFYYRGKNKTGSLTVRLKHSTNIDYRLTTKISSQKSYWFKAKGKHRKLEELSYLGGDAKNHKTYLEDVKNNLLLHFEQDNNKGIAISKTWFSKKLDELTNILSSKKEIVKEELRLLDKEKEEKKEAEDIKSKNLVTSAINEVIEKEYFNNKTQKKIYKQLLNKIKSYQADKKKIVNTKDVNQNFINGFTAYLMEDLKHQPSTARKHCKSLIHAVKYQKNAYSDKVLISENIRDIKYPKVSTTDKKKIRSEIVVTLNFDELEKIHRKEVPNRLLNAKKVILFGCEIGLRVSDYNKLTEDNIHKTGSLKFWSFYNQKTGADVVIPITKRIQSLIDIYGMPKTEYSKSADVIINKEIKEVCALAEINQLVDARKSKSVIVKGKKVRRSVSMQYPKHEVIGTHSLRRSFATLYKDVLTLFEIRQITGHASDAQLMEYINETEDKTDLLKAMNKKMNAHEVKLSEKKATLKLVKKAN
ncbi:site-specific integrase [Polaribacter litorisediminis]|uniref:phage integrase SAM-like domain-containing protein n=1 Tax=Polaribacter litorisediminis TaxID=1908341 RepID=UPI001CC0DF66|nr:phage integrase SAM-like domain-containing protein [Polaribacter litorisediminis]UAM98747.1 site-specific integrase [Polaribacter litorisediminis]